ncbi:hypothetical protein [Mameliella sediminis]|uniref:hypothetical protein n=1 Tax=Mameliella sediminis TaxID=2836866 RepID=UPI001C45D1BC|nr:hypothetical protein [Mameliella sediminis]MBY6115706.1 hypothetical protein [Antarctobacter heliothermus]MBY6145953.1 hypothetical protein [Mameliella alba]MBV7393326.1 hypothetical protein [Mameliella sediminis]MBY6161275.1 hypothetical protein [Mameliella alba]MBY6169745.1 hypothetical protein [Mameliella alba]
MATLEVDCVLEWDGLLSDPMTLTVSVIPGVRGHRGTGSFAMPARFIGTAMRGKAPLRAVAHDGSGFDLVVDRFDMMTGMAHFRTVGELPLVDRKRA